LFIFYPGLASAYLTGEHCHFGVGNFWRKISCLILSVFICFIIQWIWMKENYIVFLYKNWFLYNAKYSISKSWFRSFFYWVHHSWSKTHSYQITFSQQNNFVGLRANFAFLFHKITVDILSMCKKVTYSKTFGWCKCREKVLHAWIHIHGLYM
jgi:hypothetical protein